MSEEIVPVSERGPEAFYNRATGEPRPRVEAYLERRLTVLNAAQRTIDELRFSDPDDINVQVQDTRYRGGTGRLGDRVPE